MSEQTCKARKIIRKRAAANLALAVGAHLRRLRKAAGVRQVAIGPAIGVDQSAYSRIETGKQTLTVPQWILFQQCLGLPQDRLTKAAMKLLHGAE